MPDRLERARGLAVEERDGSFLVAGHWVNSDVDDCDCGDFIWRGGPCKHILAVKLYQERENGEEVEVAGSDGDRDRAAALKSREPQE